MSGMSGLTLEMEIAALRELLRECGSDDPEERDSALAESKGITRVVSVLVRAVAVQAALSAGDAGQESLSAVIARALDELKRGSGEAGNQAAGQQAADGVSNAAKP